MTLAEKVYATLRTIPRGKVTTYKQLARRIGSPRGARAVGNALNKNPHAPAVPCHGVVMPDGRWGGYASGPKRKTVLLRREGVMVTNEKIDLKRYGVKWK